MNKSYLIKFLITLSFLLLFLISLISGSVKIELSDFFDDEKLKLIENIVFRIRLPRVLAAILAGSALALSGAVMQSLFRNPMASPDVLGISAGSSLGALISIITGISIAGGLTMPLFSFTGGIISAVFVYTIANRRGKTHLLFLLLAGLALSSFINGLISSLLLISAEYEISQFIKWTMGGLSGIMWQQLFWPAIIIPLFLITILAMPEKLNILTQGEEQAYSLGLSVESTKIIFLTLSTVLTAMSISLAGPIAFIGLIIPHIVRLIFGSNNRTVLPFSALGGAVYLMLCDLIARRAFSPFEVKTGIITSLVGAPYFIYLILRYQKRGLGK